MQHSVFDKLALHKRPLIVIISSMSDKDSLAHIRHTLAHLLAAAVRDLFPGAKNAIGPAVDEGFYQDFAFTPTTPSRRPACAANGAVGRLDTPPQAGGEEEKHAHRRIHPHHR